MISSIRNSIYIKVLWGLMGVYLLNISVDSPDPNPEYIPEDLTINDQESIVEIFIEKILGYEDAIAEYDDLDSEEHNKKKNGNTDLLSFYSNQQNWLKNGIDTIKQNYSEYILRLTLGYFQLDTPPPKI